MKRKEKYTMANTPTTCPLKSKVWTVLLVLAVLPFALRGADLIIGAVAKGLTALTDEPRSPRAPKTTGL
jgi:hypothetical protein